MMLERLLAYRLARALQGDRLEAGWPALWRVFHRPRPGAAFVASSLALTVQRQVHLAITHPVLLRLTVNAPAAAFFSTLHEPASAAGGRITTHVMRTALRLAAPRHTHA